MSDISTVLAVLALVLSVAACFITARIAVRLQELSDLCQRFDQSQLESNARSLREVQLGLEELATSVRMSKVRRAGQSPESKSGLPDPYRDPDGWRQAVNARLGSVKIPT